MHAPIDDAVHNPGDGGEVIRSHPTGEMPWLHSIGVEFQEHFCMTFLEDEDGILFALLG